MADLIKTKRQESAVNTALNELANIPEVINYKDDDGNIKDIKIKRLKFICIEKAIQQVIRLISIVKADGKTSKIDLAGLVSLFSQSEIDNLKEIILTCLNITKEEFNNLPASVAFNVINNWIVINEDEVNTMYKHFLAVKESVLKVQKNLSTLSA